MSSAVPGCQSAPRDIVIEGDELVGFASPSGNIGCSMTADKAACYIDQRNWVAANIPPSDDPEFPDDSVGYYEVVGEEGAGHFSFGVMTQPAWAASQLPLDSDVEVQEHVRWFDPKRDVRATAGDGPEGFPVAAMSYGSTMTFGKMRCEMQRTGVTCMNTETKHGFWMARAGHTFF